MSYIVGVIGDPIRHSLSPVMQQAALKKAGIDATYEAWHVKSEQLEDFVKKAREQNYRGFNITLPHKQAIIPFLDEITPAAQVIGAVNTVNHQQGKLVGHNTDAKGFLRSLSEESLWSVNDKTITLLGAGGAARAVAYGLLNDKAQKVFIINRTVSKAQALAKDLDAHFLDRVAACAWTEEEMSECFAKSELLVNATSVGLEGSSFDSLPLVSLPPSAIVSDLVYTPQKTALLQEAKRLGLNTHEGLGMLVYQGAEAFKIWFEREPDVEIMRNALKRALT